MLKLKWNKSSQKSYTFLSRQLLSQHYHDNGNYSSNKIFFSFSSKMYSKNNSKSNAYPLFTCVRDEFP